MTRGAGDVSDGWLAGRCVSGVVGVAARLSQVGCRAIGFHAALAGTIDLDRDAYAALHDHGTLDNATPGPARGVVIDHVGTRDDAAFQDYGIAYYRYASMP